MGGNDFVKPLQYLKVNTKLWGKDGLSNIINYYNNVRRQDQYLVNNDYTINTHLFKKLINEMAKHEDKAMKLLYKKMLNVRPMKNKEKNRNPIEKNIADFEHNYYLLPTNPYHEEYKDEFKKINYNLPYLQWKKQYYNHFFNSNINIKNICSIYIKSLFFSFYYYLSGIPPSWRWTYPFRVSPLLSDLRIYLRNVNDINILNKWELNEPFFPLEQLFMIISPKNVKLLSTSYQKAMLNPPLNIYYPSTITLDVVSGGKYAYSEPILPEIEHENILKKLKTLKLTKTDNNRNQLILEPYIYGC